MDYFYDKEDRDGVRFSWNIWPSSRIVAGRLVVPIGAMYTPLKRGGNTPTVRYDPIRCRNKNCNACLNPYWYVLFPRDLGSTPLYF